jgi:hypothetical protein
MERKENMKTIDIRILSAGILFVLVIASGMWVTKMGRPLNAGVFTVHKLIALAALILMIVIVRTLARGIVLNPLMTVCVVLTFLFFIVMFATGAVLSFEKPAPGFVLLLHKIAPALTLMASAAAVMLMKGKGIG